MSLQKEHDIWKRARYMKYTHKYMSTSVVPNVTEEVKHSSRDPISSMIEIVENPNITNEDKTRLIQYAKERFKNRRTMAYFSLYTIIGSLIFIYLMSFVDGVFGTKIVDIINGNGGIVKWALGFLTTIVAAYFGVSSWRPSS